MNLSDELVRISDLHKQGDLNDAEFALAKAELLAEHEVLDSHAGRDASLPEPPGSSSGPIAFCQFCGHPVGDADICEECGAYRVGRTWHQLTDKDRMAAGIAESEATSAPASPMSRYLTRTTLAIAGVIAIGLVAVIVVLIALSGGGSAKKAAAPSRTVAERTTETASTLRSDLCVSATSSSCQVDGTTPGVITVYMSEYAVSEDALRKAGTDSGLWSNADVARMLTTRALDGTQRTSDGSVSWTFHPDNGFQMVVDVSKAPQSS